MQQIRAGHRLICSRDIIPLQRRQPRRVRASEPPAIPCPHFGPVWRSQSSSTLPECDCRLSSKQSSILKPSPSSPISIPSPVPPPPTPLSTSLFPPPLPYPTPILSPNTRHANPTPQKLDLIRNSNRSRRPPPFSSRPRLLSKQYPPRTLVPPSNRQSRSLHLTLRSGS